MALQEWQSHSCLLAGRWQPLQHHAAKQDTSLPVSLSGWQYCGCPDKVHGLEN